MYKKTIVLVGVLLVLVIGVDSMALSDVGKVCLFSEISGVITMDGKPVANAKLVRTARKENDITDETMTDENGYFKMPAIGSSEKNR